MAKCSQLFGGSPSPALPPEAPVRAQVGEMTRARQVVAGRPLREARPATGREEAGPLLVAREDGCQVVATSAVVAIAEVAEVIATLDRKRAVPAPPLARAVPCVDLVS